MHFFTSININYLPKARVLAKSIRAHCPNAFFSLVLYDEVPAWFDLSREPFDELVTMEDLNLPVYNLRQWIYMHNVVELGTAIKGQAALNFLERSEQVVYIDPDIVVYQDLAELERLLETYDCVLTPHQLAPDSEEAAIVGNEIGSMLRGTYNFGFFAFSSRENGKRIAAWYRDRLLEYCYDEVENGLFTDQRWGNMIPALFENVCIWRNPGCNVSTWNITRRYVDRDADGRYTVNGSPLLFYHFSGFDSGAQLSMVNFFGNGNLRLYELRDDYTRQLEENGQSELLKKPFIYNFYQDGTPITDAQRRTMRHRKDLIKAFRDTDPFDNTTDGCYYRWYLANASAGEPFVQEQDRAADLRRDTIDAASHAEQIAYYQKAIDDIRASFSWRITKPLRRIKALFCALKSHFRHEVKK